MTVAHKAIVFGSCLFNVVLLSIGHAIGNTSVVLISIVLFFAVLVVTSPVLFLPVMLFYLPWSPMMKLDAAGFSYYTIGFALFFMVLFFTKEMRGQKGVLQLPHLAFVCGLCLYTLLMKGVFGHELALGYWMFLFMCYSVPIYMRLFYEQLSFEACALYLTTGVLLASFAAQLLMELPHLRSFIEVSTWEGIGLTRLSGFYGDANFYAVHILVAICSLLIVILRKDTYAVVLLFSMVLALIYVGLLSVSKMFLLVLVSVLGLWFVAVLLQKERLISKIVVFVTCSVGMFVVMATGAFAQQLDMYAVRFQMVSDVSSLTTGRADIVGEYFTFFTQHPLALWFGQGFTQVYVGEVTSAAHNTLMQIVYQFGLVGLVLLVGWLMSIWRWRRFSLLSSALTMVCFAPWLALDMLFADELFLIACLFVVGQRELVA